MMMMMMMSNITTEERDNPDNGKEIEIAAAEA